MSTTSSKPYRGSWAQPRKTPSISGSVLGPQDTKTSVTDDSLPPKLADKLCSLWVHDDNFSKEDVLLNPSFAPKGSISPGDLVEVAALKSNIAVRDFQDPPRHQHSKESDGRATSQPLDENGRSVTMDRAVSGRTTVTGQIEGRYDVDPHKRYIFVAKEMSSDLQAKYPNLQVSISSHVANIFGFKNRQQVLVSVVDDNLYTASHVELSFRDQYLSRADMWRLAKSELSGKSIHKGQKILFLGTIKALVRNVYLRGRRVQSAYFSPTTKPIFRSESARYTLFIQMSKEMWDFDSEGTAETMFNKVINGFLPELFKRWVRMNARHIVSIVLFTRVELESVHITVDARNADPTIQTGPDGKLYKDYFRVVVSEMSSGEWATILEQLKKEYRVFLRDVSVQNIVQPLTVDSTMGGLTESNPQPQAASVIAGRPSIALHGNILEAINLASSQFAMDYVDRDLVRTGISIVVITPSPGVFEVDYEMLKATTESLVGNGIGIDLVCLSRMPLHSVPLFKYRTPRPIHGIDDEHPKGFSPGTTPRQGGEFGKASRRLSNISSSFSNPGTSPRFKSSHLTSFTHKRWSFAIPHWIDISFWSRSTNETLHQLNEDNSIRLISRPGPKHASNFVSRCKMYELQMMGIMENELSNISVAYLHEDPLYAEISGPGVSKLPTSLKPNFTGGITSNSYTSSSIRRGRDHGLVSTKDDRASYKWMDLYDNLVFQPLDRIRNFERDLKRQTRDKERKAYERLQDDDTLVFGTSFDDKAEGLSPGMAGSSFLDRKMQEVSDGDALATRRSSISSTISNIKTPVKRPPRLARNISFGLRGFSGAAPKALASTELNIEHAMKHAISGPGPVLHRGFQPETIDGGSTSQLPHILSRTTSRSTLVSAKENSTQSPTSDEKQKGNSNKALKETRVVPNPEESSKPIAIKASGSNTEQQPESGNRGLSSSLTGDASEEKRNMEKLGVLQAASITKQAGPKLDLASSAGANDLAPTLSPTSALAPWLSILNPSNPAKNRINPAAQFRRWQHVFPRPHRASSIKWKSLCSPAAVPLTTEYFPTAEQLSKEYHESLYNISLNEDDDLRETPRTRDALFMELIAFRLTQGFQIVVGPAVAETLGSAHAKVMIPYGNEQVEIGGLTVFMSMGNAIHQLQCVDEDEVEIKRYVRKPAAFPSSQKAAPMVYRPVIRTMLDDEYKPRQIVLQPPSEEYNWNYVDSFVAGYVDSFAEGLRYWRARFVLIPVNIPQSSRRVAHPHSEDNEEEVRIEGIRKLTQLWQRYRYIPSDERQVQLPSRLRKDTNPLDIEYQTRDPSVVVAAEVEGMSILEPDPYGKRTHLFTETEPFQRSNINMMNLALEIQGEKGVRLMDRRWHWRIHFNCFKGDELTTWLLENFRDVESREEAVELGIELMEKGLFQHVEKRHQFRDGNYFYQISTEYRSRPESRTGWWSTRRSDKSIPSTPMGESQRDSPRISRTRSDSNTDDGSTDPGSTTPTASSAKKMRILLSKSMRYNVDHRNRSYRQEIINLHYDRLHNPDNCYHIRIDWMNVTSKLIEDAVLAWGSLAEKYGLKLVEVPIAEACNITDVQPFRSPSVLKLAVQPPNKQPQALFEATSFSPHSSTDKFYYQKALLKKFNFVLDLEAAKSFSVEVDVTYSWGRPDYRYSQYIHRSGTVLAQIMDDGNLLLLANRLYNNRTPAAKESTKFDRTELQDRRAVGNSALSSSFYLNSALSGIERASPYPSPLLRPVTEITSPFTLFSTTNNPTHVSPEKIRDELDTFCKSAIALNKFYDEILTKTLSPTANTPVLESNIPSLGLPPNLSQRDGSLSPTLRPSTSEAPPATHRTPSAQSGSSNLTD